MTNRRISLTVTKGTISERGPKFFIPIGEPMVAAELVTEEVWNDEAEMKQVMKSLMKAHRRAANDD